MKMLKLIDLHWWFIRYPSKMIEQEIPHWPVGIGVLVSVLYTLVSGAGGARQINQYTTVIQAVFGYFEYVDVYILATLSACAGVLIHWHIMTYIVRWLAPGPTESFDKDLYRKLIFYAPTPYVILAVFAQLPIEFCSFMLNYWDPPAVTYAMVALVLMIPEVLIAIWAAVAMIMGMVLIWKGLRRYFGLSLWRTFLAEFAIPLLLASPILYLVFSRMWPIILAHAGQ